MPVQLYGMLASAPCRIVAMTCEVLKVEYEFKDIDLMKNEHKTEEYLKINPQHNIPAIVDGDFKMNESRAIAQYLANKYGKEDNVDLYPKDPEVRARVDMFLYFDMGAFYKSFGECVYPMMFGEMKEIPADKMARLEEVLGWVENYVKETGYAAETASMTLADIAWTATLSTIDSVGIVDMDSKFPGVKAYLTKMKGQIPNYEKADGQGAAMFGQWYKSKTSA